VKTHDYFTPIKIVEVELSRALPELRSDGVYGSAQVYVCLHGSLLGQVEIPFNSGTLIPEDYAPTIYQSFAEEINAHLLSDGLSSAASLPVNGLTSDSKPQCRQKIAEFMKSAPFVSVILCTHDRTEYLKGSVPALLDLDYPRYEIIVVDNAPSTTATFDFISTRYGDEPRIRYVREDQAGLSWARNCGIRNTQAEYIAFTDDDARVDREWLLRLMLNFFAMDNVACVTGQILPAELETQPQLWFEQFGGLGKDFQRKVFDMEEYRGDNTLYPYTVGEFGAGVNMAFRTEVARQLGGFEVKINQADDISMFLKVITNGFRIIFDPTAFLFHTHRRDYDGLTRQVFNYGVGLSSFFTHLIVSDWLQIFRIGPRIPLAMLYLLNPKSSKNKRKPSTYPAKLTWLERKGMVYGPFKYFKYTREIRGITTSTESTGARS
jgi:glycosyltransferase involved in cell wall biosynthesis